MTWSTFIIMTNIEESRELQDYRRSVFGNYQGSETMPEAFLSQLRHLTEGADVVLAVRYGDKARTAFWLKGIALGHLACTGSTDADAEIQGWVLRLDQVAQIDIDVKLAPGAWDDYPWVSGRVLKINGDPLLDASPGKFVPDKLAGIEEFIDRVLVLHAGTTA